MVGKIKISHIKEASKKALNEKRQIVLHDGSRLSLVISYIEPNKGAWYLHVGSAKTQKRIKIGVYQVGNPDHLDLDQARVKALKIKCNQNENISNISYNVSHEENNNVTLKDLSIRYITLKSKVLSKSTIKLYSSASNALDNIGLLQIPVDSLTPQNVRSAFLLLVEKNKQGVIKVAFSYLRILLTFGANEQLHKPIYLPELNNLLPALEKSQRRKMISLEDLQALIEKLIEMAKVGKVQHKIKIQKIVLLLATACRVNEILQFQEKELSGNWLTIPANRMKAKKEHSVYILDALIPLFNSKNTCTIQVLFNFKKIHLSDFNFDFHGFRSLFLTVMFGKYPNMEAALSACIAHGKSHANESDKFYNRYTFEEEKKLLFSEWFKYLQENTNIDNLINLIKD